MQLCRHYDRPDMEFHQLRNATAVLTLAEHRLLIDPMLSRPGAILGFKLFGGGRRNNPLVPLPPGSDAALDSVTGVLVTHRHPDHLDRPGIEWIRARALPVWASGFDAAKLRRKGLDAHELVDGALGMGVEVIPVEHGRGLVGWLMGRVSGCYLAHPDEPSVLLTSDAIASDALLEAIERLRPDVIVAPAGAANFGLGSDIMFGLDELIRLARTAPGRVIFNHLEALDHCPTTRDGLRARIEAEGLGAKVEIPADGGRVPLARA